MKTIWILSCLLMGITLQVAAQNFTISGNVKSASGTAVGNASVVLRHTSHAVVCDSLGYYQLNNISAGSYTLQISAVGFATATREVKVSANLTVNAILVETAQQLQDVTIKGGKEKTFGITRLKTVEGTTINAGKKSEVIVLSDLTANTSTNNSRQIYSRVAGLNIWESDGAGLQLGIGGRGLNPNRVTNFNTRQNGYDISADALGYPESYYTPPAEMTDRIEILRGASSLQYGTQFGGLINFKLKDGPADKPIEFTSRATAGSWGFLNTSTSLGGTVGKWQYYTFYQHKQGDGWRPNAGFNANTAYASATYKANDKLSMTAQYTYTSYLAHQAGGLTDAGFAADPRQSNRARNWFKINWNLGAFILDYRLSDNLKLNSRFFGLLADRDAVGNLDLINRIDVGGDRNLYKDQFRNYGNETRLLYSYKMNAQPQTLLVGVRYYNGHTDRQQGFGNNGSTGTPSDFDYGTSVADQNAYSHYTFPSNNVALFTENIFHITSKFSIIPGIRYEHINTKADGTYNVVNSDQAGNVIFSQMVHDDKNSNRHFLIAGVGLSYYQNEAMQFYGNITQNYRAINFSDLYSIIKAVQVDPKLADEKGFSADFGMRGNIASVFNYDISVFNIYYNNRIGTYEAADASNNTFRYRTNIGASENYGLESFGELEVLHFINGGNSKTKVSVFSNLALINAKYVRSQQAAFQGKKVELAPDVIFKSGLTFKREKFSASYQLTYTSSQFTDATNAVFVPSAVDGLVPAYTVMDLSADYKLSKIFTLQGSVNNLADARYFTRRADSYPGPGIIPADARAFYLTLQVKL
jgi:Fe(3+) dicitrate transport protein